MVKERIDHLNELLHRVDLLKTNGYKVLILSLDIIIAYHCVDIGLLCDMLLECGVHTYFLSLRILRLRKAEVVVSNGLPLGSCLPLLMFNICILWFTFYRWSSNFQMTLL